MPVTESVQTPAFSEPAVDSIVTESVQTPSFSELAVNSILPVPDVTTDVANLSYRGPSVVQDTFSKRSSGDSQQEFDKLSLHESKLAKLSSKISVSELVILELCAGSANLSAEFKALGFQVLPIDHQSNRHKQKCRTIVIDLASEGALLLVSNILFNANVLYCHMAPPCGTASAARNKPVPWALRQQGAPSPIPLRSQEHPLGFPWLKGLDKEKVRLANCIYLLISEVSKICLRLGIILSIENPLNSLFWAIWYILALKENPQLEFVVFQACMHGGTRNKWTAWLGTKGVFSSMALTCDNKHTHDGWNLTKSAGRWQFDTALEAEYARQLCATVAQLVLAVALSRGYEPISTDVHGFFSEVQRRLWKRATTGKLPRGRRLPQVVSEFLSITEVIGDYVVQKDTRILRRFYRKREDSATETVNIIGKWRTPQQFLEAATSARHPYDATLLVSDELKRALFNVLTLGPLALTKSRTAAVCEISALAKKLESVKLPPSNDADPHNLLIMAKKRWALF